MADEIDDGTNPQLTNEQRNAKLAELDAEIAREDAQRQAATSAPAESAKTETKQAASIPQKATAPEEKKDAPQQKQADGNDDLEKIQDNIKHLDEGIKETAEEKERLSKMSHEEKVAHFLKVKKEKAREYTQGRQALAEERKAIVESAPQNQPPPYIGDLTPELKTQVLADLEKDPVATIDRLLQARLNQALDQKVKPALSDWQEEKSRNAEKREAEELASLAKEHPWMMTEGLARFEKVFEANPWLKQSPNPYKDAIRFMDDLPSKNGMTPGSAQAGSNLPILGSSGVVPPSGLDKSVAVESSFKELESLHEFQIKTGKYVDAEKTEAKMRKMALGK